LLTHSKAKQEKKKAESEAAKKVPWTEAGKLFSLRLSSELSIDQR
jgi:hypothetical protein